MRTRLMVSILGMFLLGVNVASPLGAIEGSGPVSTHGVPLDFPTVAKDYLTQYGSPISVEPPSVVDGKHIGEFYRAKWKLSENETLIVEWFIRGDTLSTATGWQKTERHNLTPERALKEALNPFIAQYGDPVWHKEFVSEISNNITARTYAWQVADKTLIQAVEKTGAHVGRGMHRDRKRVANTRLR